MTKRVLDIGNCAMDHAAIRQLLENEFAAQVVHAHRLDDALSALQSGPFDLVLVNRILDSDQSSGLEVIQKIKACPEAALTPVMMVTNFAEHQDRAVAAGAVRGFGKSQLHSQQTRQLLARFLQN